MSVSDSHSHSALSGSLSLPALHLLDSPLPSPAVSLSTHTHEQTARERERERELRRELAHAQRRLREQEATIAHQAQRIRELESRLLALDAHTQTHTQTHTLAVDAQGLTKHTHCSGEEEQPTLVAPSSQPRVSQTTLLHSSTAPPGMLSLHTYNAHTHNADAHTDAHTAERENMPAKRSLTVDEEDLRVSDYVTPQAVQQRKFFAHTYAPLGSEMLDTTHTTHAEGSPDSHASSGAPDTLSVGSVDTHTRPHMLSHNPSLSHTLPLPSCTSPRLRPLSHSSASGASERASEGEGGASLRRSQSKLSSSRSKLARFKALPLSHNAHTETPTPTIHTPTEQLSLNTHTQLSPSEPTHTPSHTRSLVHTTAKFSPPKVEPDRVKRNPPWVGENASSPHLFVFHDNPQLEKSVSGHINAFQSMGVLIETHARKDLAKFLVGNLVYSNTTSEVHAHLSAASASSFCPEEVRGGSCFVVSGLRAVQGDLKAFPRRERDGNTGIVELRLFRGGAAVAKENTSSEVQEVDVSSTHALTHFLSDCDARVDLVLHPLCTSSAEGDHWYPYYEGARKLAPQFRSKGLGYVRLGDDMSQFGTSFLSLDGGEHHLDHPLARERYIFAPNAASSDALSQTSSHKHGKEKSTSKKSLSENLRKIVKQERESKVTDAAVVESKAETSSESALSSALLSITQHLEALESATKWTDRVDALNALCSVCVSVSAHMDVLVSAHPSLANTLISRLTDVMSKQSNPQALSAALSCFASLHMSASVADSLSLPWRNAVLEMFYSLRANTKMVSESAARTLSSLHMGSTSSGVPAGPLSWQVMASVCADALSGARTSSSNASTKRKGVTAANTAKVLLWLQSVSLSDIAQYTRVLSSADRAQVSESHVTSACEALSACLSHCQETLTHREEAVRESTLTVCAQLLALETMLSRYVLSCKTSPPPGVWRQTSQSLSALSQTLTHVLSAEDLENAFSCALPRSSASLALCLTLRSSLNPKSFGRLCAHTAQSLAMCCGNNMQ